MGSEKVGATECGEDGEERFGGPDFVLEAFESVGQGVAGGPTEGAETEGVEKDAHLVADASGGVLKIAVVEAEAGVDPQSGDAIGQGDLDLAREVFGQHRGGV